MQTADSSDGVFYDANVDLASVPVSHTFGYTNLVCSLNEEDPDVPMNEGVVWCFVLFLLFKGFILFDYLIVIDK